MKGAAAANADPIVMADRLFGGPSHMILVDDHRAAVAFMGWKIGSGRAVCDEDGRSRSVTVEIMIAESGDYALCQRIETELADGATTLEARVELFPSGRDVRRFVEHDIDAADPVRDMAMVAALDHSARIWPWLRRQPRRATSSAISTHAIPFPL
jgi:hypothetical protein